MQTATSQPKRLAQYEIVEPIALLGKVRIYRALDTASQRSVALKTIPRDLNDREIAATITQFQEQARISIGLKHSGIVEVYEYGEDADLAFLASEFVEGCSLKSPLRVPIADAGSLIAQLLNALDHAHTQGVVHLEIKPSSLLLTSKGQLRIADFGVPGPEPRNSGYKSPEQLTGSTVDARSDVFAVGVMFYELLTGGTPFAGPPEELSRRICQEKERPASQANPNVPAVFDPVCAKSLAKVPADRYSTARAFCNDLQGAFKAALGTPPADLVSNETVVSVFLSSLRGDSRKSRSGPPGPKPEPLPPAPVPGSQWPDETLRTVEKQLAAFIGPLARVIVKEAASQTTDLGKLYDLAAESLSKPHERKAFLAAQPGGRLRIEDSEVPQTSDVRAAEATTATAFDSRPVLERRSAIPKPVSAAKPVSELEPKPAVKSPSSARPRLESKPVSPPVEAKPGPPPALPSLVPDSKPKLSAEVRPQPSTPAEPELDIVSRLEELLGKQPENLAGYLAEQPPEVVQVIHAFVAATEALVALGAANAKSGGLTPQSIRFDRMGKATIQAASATSIQGTTLGGMGSPRYTAPEIFEEKSAAADIPVATADIYALGFMFYEILLGRKLFRETFANQRTDLDWLRWHADAKSKAPPLKSLLPDRPAAISELLESMMEKDAEKRAPDPAVILSRLRGTAQQLNTTIVARKPAASVKTAARPNAMPAHSSRKKSGAGLMLILAVLLLLAVVGLFVSQNPALYRKLIPPANPPAQTPDPPAGNRPGNQ